MLDFEVTSVVEYSVDLLFVRFVYTKTISPLMGGYRVAQAA